MNPALTGRDVMKAEGRKNGMPRERRPWKAAAIRAA